MISYFLSNNSAKNYRNQIAYVNKIIQQVKGDMFFHEHCMINVRLLQCCVSEQTADEARVSENFFLVLLFTAEVSERVDNDAENEVQDDDDDDEEEDQVIDDSRKEQSLLQQPMHTLQQPIHTIAGRYLSVHLSYAPMKHFERNTQELVI